MPRYPSSQGGDKKSKETWATKRPLLPESELPVLPEELCVGSMVWLRQRFPNEDDITCIREGHCTGFILREAGYMHPVVILKVWQRPGSEQPGDLMLAVSELTGFRDNTTLASYARKRSELIKFWEAIPILHKGEPKYGETEQLELESGWMRKKSWIRLQHVLLVPVSYFWKYDWHEGAHAYDQRLTKQSYERLMSLVNMEGDEYETTGSVVTNATSRLARLASQEGWKLREKERKKQPAIQEAGIQQFETKKGNLATYPLAEDIQLQSSYSPRRDSTTKHHLRYQSSSENHRPSQPFPTYGVSPIYPPSAPVNTWTLHNNHGFNPAMTSNNGPGYMPGYGTPHFSQPHGLYPPAFPSCVQPAVNNNNFHFHGSSASFSGPINQDVGKFPNQHMQPNYHNLEQQWQQGLVQQQQALNRYFDHQAQQNRQPGYQQVGEEWQQGRVPQQSMSQYSSSQTARMGQPISHPPTFMNDTYSQITHPYSPTPTQRANPFLQPLLEQQQRNRAMQTQAQPQIPNAGPHLRRAHMPFQSPHPRNQPTSNAHTRRTRQWSTNVEHSDNGSTVQPTSNFQTNRTAQWTTNVAHSDNISMVSDCRNSQTRPPFSPPPQTASYHSPQVEDCEESEAGYTEENGDRMGHN